MKYNAFSLLYIRWIREIVVPLQPETPFWRKAGVVKC